MISTRRTEPTYSYRTVETAEPMTDEELEEKAMRGWRYIRTTRRTSKAGKPYLVYEFEKAMAYGYSVGA